jgi:hypothetical protein
MNFLRSIDLKGLYTLSQVLEFRHCEIVSSAVEDVAHGGIILKEDLELQPP